MKFEECEAPISEERLAEAEREIGFALPPPYRAHLLRHNGGRPEPCGFRFVLEGEEPEDAMVAWFFAIHDGPHERLLEEREAYRNRIPTDTLAIARDPGGNLILLGIEGPNAGKIFFWIREEESDEDEAPDYRNVGWVADGFDEWIASLDDL